MPSRPLGANRGREKTEISIASKIFFRHASGVPFMSATEAAREKYRDLFGYSKYAACGGTSAFFDENPWKYGFYVFCIF
jgi:hypothetical protein